MPLKIIPYNPILKERARQLRQNMTPGEVKLWQHLKGKQMCGYDFDRQRPIDQYIVDFYCKRLMLAIEIDGSSHDSQERQHRDGERQARLDAILDKISKRGYDALNKEEKDFLFQQSKDV